jgi:hypothetical protein
MIKESSCPYIPIDTSESLSTPSTPEEREERKNRIIEDADALRLKEWESANSINANPSFENVALQLDIARSTLRHYYEEKSPASAVYSTTRRLRTLPLRLIAHHFADDLMPVTHEVLRSPEIIERLLAQKALEGFMDPNAAVEATHGKVFHGDEARIAIVLFNLLYPIAEDTVQRLPPAVHWASETTTQDLKNQAALRLGIMGRPVQEILLQEEGEAFIKDDHNDLRTHEHRFLEFQAADLPADPRTFLADLNLVAQIEHLVPVIGDLYREYTEAGTPVDLQLRTAVQGLRWFRMLAHLRSESGGRLEYKDRYVWQSSAGKDRLVSKRKPMVSVSRIDDDEWDIFGTRAPYTQKLADRDRDSRCPAKDAVLPNALQIPRSELFIQDIAETAGIKRFPTHLLTQGIAEADVVSVLALAVTEQLRSLGVISLTAAEFALHLGASQKSDSAVTWRKRSYAVHSRNDS